MRSVIMFKCKFSVCLPQKDLVTRSMSLVYELQVLYWLLKFESHLINTISVWSSWSDCSSKKCREICYLTYHHVQKINLLALELAIPMYTQNFHQWWPKISFPALIWVKICIGVVQIEIPSRFPPFSMGCKTRRQIWRTALKTPSRFSNSARVFEFLASK